jgi:hypothetical protein
VENLSFTWSSMALELANRFDVEKSTATIYTGVYAEKKIAPIYTGIGAYVRYVCIMPKYHHTEGDHNAKRRTNQCP